MSDMALCENCGAEFKKNTHNHKYCKLECKVEHRRERRGSIAAQIASLLEEEFGDGEPSEVDGEEPPIKILFLDIETSPNLVWTWGLRNQFISLNQIEEQTRMLCMAGKFYGEDIQFFSEFHDGTDRMIEKVWQLLDEADVIVHWNGARFDVPHIQREFLEAGLPPVSYFAEVDLMKVVRKQFRFVSNKLQNVSRVLGLEGKAQHEGFELWRKCMNGDKSAWETMKEYNIQDVQLLEDLYEKLLPWIPNHPNLRLHNSSGCPRCGSMDFQKRGVRRTQVSVYQQYQCNQCNGYFRDTRRNGSTDLRVS